MSYERAIAVRPTTPRRTPTAATRSRRLRRFEEALASYDRAIALRPDYRRGAFQSRRRAQRAASDSTRRWRAATARWRCGRIMPRRTPIAATRCRSCGVMTRRWRATIARWPAAGLRRGAHQSRQCAARVEALRGGAGEPRARHRAAAGLCRGAFQPRQCAYRSCSATTRRWRATIAR